MLIYLSIKRDAHAPVAQLDRVTDYESVGQGFESLPAYQEISISCTGMLISIVKTHLICAGSSVG